MTTTVSDSLRALATFLESRPDIDAGDQYITLIHYVDTREKLAAIAASGAWSKVPNDNFFTLRKDFGNGVRFHAYTDRSQVCRKRVIGKRLVPAQPEHEVEVVEWDCDEPLLAAK